ncbi:hypothetical protein ACTFIU_010400 [Dictyostelium citrinum]
MVYIQKQHDQSPQPQQPQQNISQPLVQPTIDLQSQQQLKDIPIPKLNEYLKQLQQNEKPQLNSSQSSIKTEVHEVPNIEIKNNEPMYEETFLTEKSTPNHILPSNQFAKPSSSKLNRSQDNTIYFYSQENQNVYKPLSVCVENNALFSSNIESLNDQKAIEIKNDAPFLLENGFRIKFKSGFKDKLLINGNSIIPHGVTHVIFNEEYNRRIEPGSFPNSVKKIEFGKKYNNGGSGIEEGVFPNGLEELLFQHHFSSKVNDAPLPTSLKILKIGCHKMIHHDNASRYSVVKAGIKHSPLLTNFNHLTNLKQVTLGFCFEGALPQSLLNLRNVRIISSSSYRKSSPSNHVIDNNLGCSL